MDHELKQGKGPYIGLPKQPNTKALSGNRNEVEMKTRCVVRIEAAFRAYIDLFGPCSAINGRKELKYCMSRFEL